MVPRTLMREPQITSWSRAFLLGIILLLAHTRLIAAALEISVDMKQGLPSISLGGGPVVSASYSFWAGNWKWAETSTRVSVASPFNYKTTGKNALGFNLEGPSRKTGD